MKTSTKKGLIFLLLLLVAKMGFTQPGGPSYELYITNEAFTSATKFQFDVWIKRTGAGVFELSNIQASVNVNSALKGAGTITAALVAGSSQLNGATAPLAGNVTWDGTANRVSITPRTPPGCGNGTIITNFGTCPSPGVRVATIQLTLAGIAAWPAAITPNLDFNTSVAPITQAFYYPIPCTGNDAAINVTYLDANPLQSCTTNPTTPNCTNITLGAISSVTNNVCFGTSTGSFNIAYSWTAVGNTTRTSIDGGSFVITSSAIASNGNRTFTGLSRGVHIVKVERGTGLTVAGGGTPNCTYTYPMFIGGPTQAVSATAAMSHAISCFGGTDGAITVTPTGGNSAAYVITPATTTDLGAGSYTYQVNDGCPQGPATTNTVVLTDPPAINMGTPNITAASCLTCFNGAVTINGAGGGTGQLTYYLNQVNDPFAPYQNTTGVFSGLEPGDYTLDIVDASGCAGTQALITIPVQAGCANPPTAGAGSPQTVCGNGTDVNLSPSIGGSATSGSWSGGAGSFTGNVYHPAAADYLAGS